MALKNFMNPPRDVFMENSQSLRNDEIGNLVLTDVKIESVSLTGVLFVPGLNASIISCQIQC